ncbi:porin family protein [Kaustia mangrovi]|uniref:Porin family protein n=1 Tax=Kaustia mangrovi TaxID=2593653 RepID=A0A7S8C320_9HYPH|nr:outer membrane protein [Kaustia mangrovi]QPC42446.1 porin family protein [Kaustia mangrovi]
MKTTLMAGVAAAGLGLALAAGAGGAPAAQAADLYVPPPPPPPMWSWTGFYGGVHAGMVDGDIDGDPFFGQKSDFSNNETVLDPNGFMGGIQAGYNYQIDSIVLGVEGDFSLGDVDDTAYPFVFGPSRAEAQIDWMATIRARVGWAMDRTLFYATGGMAFTDLELKLDSAGFGDKDSNSYFGWTVGGGVEHAVTDHITLKAEYLYADFGKEGFSFYGGGQELPETSDDFKLKTHTFRVGVNYLF